MQIQPLVNNKAPLLCWDFFTIQYNALLKNAEKHFESVCAIKQIAKNNKWTTQQTNEAVNNISEYVIVITDDVQKIAFTGKGFEEMTGYSFEEAKGRNPKFLQGPGTNKQTTQLLKQKIQQNETGEFVLENYRKNGDLYLCKIVIKPILNTNNKLVNYIAYEQEIAA